MLEANQCPVKHSDNMGLKFINVFKSKQEELGQYFTPHEVSTYMASMLALPIKDEIKLLDPGAGGGVLIASTVKHLVTLDTRKEKSYIATLYEIDVELIPTLKKSMSFLQKWCADNQISFDYVIKNEDYILSNASVLDEKPSLFKNELFDIVISNPPYFKISKNDERAICCSLLVYGQPNIYSLFMGVASSQLMPGGQLVFITPRSFSSGQYFKSFRKHFFKKINIDTIHVFESRKNAFERDFVLQENIICYGTRSDEINLSGVCIKTSNGKSDLISSSELNVHRSLIIDIKKDFMLCLPTNEKDLQLLKTTHSWENSLEKMGLKISTGPIVPFRATEYLMKEQTKKSVPLLWVQHILPMKTKFPLDVFRKQQWFLSDDTSKKLLVEDQNMILMRRFSPKEDFRRLTVAPHEKESLGYQYIGLENHLNYIYSPQKKFIREELYGLAAFLNSKIFDSYFRITNGNTQVSATELRTAPLPSKKIITEIGIIILKTKTITHSEIDAIIEEVIESQDLQ